MANTNELMDKAMSNPMLAAYIKMFKNWSDFSGRTSRYDFWMAVAVNFIISLILGLLFSSILYALIPFAYSLVVLVPGIALGIRRMHDIGKSGWWTLIALVPVAGAIILIVWSCKESSPDNEWGPKP